MRSHNYNKQGRVSSVLCPHSDEGPRGGLVRVVVEVLVVPDLLDAPALLHELPAGVEPRPAFDCIVVLRVHLFFIYFIFIDRCARRRRKHQRKTCQMNYQKKKVLI